MVTFGVHTGPQDIKLDDLRRFWRYCDGAGFDWISVWDHFYEAPPIDGSHPAYEGVAAMACLAADTQNVAVACLVFCAGYRHPGVLANALVTIDHISGGRLNAGLGAGWHEPEFAAYGIPFPGIGTRMDVLEESVQIVRSLFDNETTTFESKYFQLKNARCEPKPLRRAPIWIGGIGEKRTLRIAARYADGWNAPYISADQFKAKCRVLDQWCEKAGRDPTTVQRTVNLGFYMGADGASAKRYREVLERSFGALLADRIGGFLVGTPSEVADQVGAFVEAGASRINLAIRPPIDQQAVEAFVSEVMPRFARS
jgi:F420-dependent oxidoreductase-like protein